MCSCNQQSTKLLIFLLYVTESDAANGGMSASSYLHVMLIATEQEWSVLM